MILRQQQSTRSPELPNDNSSVKETALLPLATKATEEEVISTVSPESELPTDSLTSRQEENSHSPVRSPCSSRTSPASLQSDRSLLDCILSTQGHWGYDRRSQSLRYFGSTTNIHFYGSLDGSEPPRTDISQHPTKNILKELSRGTHDYLLDLYWDYYNSVLQVVSKSAFLEGKDQANNNSPYYSRFLHICLLAMGFRFADLERPDMQRLLIGQGPETILFREARRLLDHELDVSPSIPTVQALLVLADISCAAGKDNSGWLYTGEC